MLNALRAGIAIISSLAIASASHAQAQRLRVAYGSATLELVVEPSSVRGDDFAMYACDERGRAVRIMAPPSRTVRGRALGIPGSSLSGAMLADGLHAQVVIPSFGTLDVTPSGDAHAARLVEPDETQAFACGWEETNDISAKAANGLPGGCTGVCVVDLAIDIDSAALALYGSAENAVASIEADIETINATFEVFAGVRFEIGTLVLREDAMGDPYANLPVIDRLVMSHVVGKEWRDAMGGVERDTVMVVTGIDFPFIAGVNIGVACGPSDEDGFGPRGFAELGSPGFRVTLAHELGHAVGANHCQSRGEPGTRGFLCPDFLMNSGGTTGLRMVSDARGVVGEGFEADTTGRVESSLRNPLVDCLDTAPGTTRFIREPDTASSPLGPIDPRAWLETQNVTPVTDGADGPIVAFDRPSATSLRLRTDATLATGALDARLRDRFEIELVVARGAPGDAPDTGDALAFEYLDDTGAWIPAHTFDGDGASGEAIASFTIDEPGAIHDAVRFRYRTTGAHDVADTDDWYVVSTLIRDRFTEIDPPIALSPSDGAAGVGIEPSDGLFQVDLEWKAPPGVFRSVAQVVAPEVLVEDDPETPADETVYDEPTFFTSDKMEFPTGEQSRSVLTLAKGTRYAWRVVSFTNEGVARVSEPNVFDTIDAIPPGPPAVASPIDGSVSATASPTFIFIAPNSGDEVETYTLLIDDGPSFASPIEIGEGFVFDPTMSFATYTPPTGLLADNTTYAWRVDATNAGGTSSSSVRTFTVRTCPADCDEDGDTDFDDLICALFMFGEATAGRADCDGNGAVEFNDLVCAVTGFGGCE